MSHKYRHDLEGTSCLRKEIQCMYQIWNLWFNFIRGNKTFSEVYISTCWEFQSLKKLSTRIHIPSAYTCNLMYVSDIIYHSIFDSFFWAPMSLGKGSRDSFTMRGCWLWLKQWIWMLFALYFLKVFWVSSCVLKEFIRTSGTEQPYLLFKCCERKGERQESYILNLEILYTFGVL